jgi:hypothetical protein
MTLPRTAFCLFCDDAQQEVNSKMSYMGVYPANLTFPPSTDPNAQYILPRLFLPLWLNTDVNDKLEHVTITVSIPPGRTKILRLEVPAEQLAAHTYGGSVGATV